MIDSMNPKVDDYFAVGCGRCPLGNTPECKVHNWQEEMKLLRQILLDCGLIEEVKWSVPCYTVGNGNVVILSAFKAYCSLSFFKGALLKDPEGVLVQPSKHSQAARLIKFTDVAQVVEMESILKDTIYEAIEVEKAGLKVDFSQKDELEYPEELQNKFDEDPALEAAFEALTLGRQRGYVLHFSGAKQSKTRVSRIEKCIPKIFEGKGFHDR